MSKLDMAGRPLPDRTYPAETGSKGYQLHDKTLGQWKGSNVGIWATNVPDWLTFLYATAKIGAVLVTVNTNYKQNELEYLCKDSDMEVLCITDGTIGVCTIRQSSCC